MASNYLLALCVLITVVYCVYTRQLYRRLGRVPGIHALVAFLLPICIATMLLSKFSSLQLGDVWTLLRSVKEPGTLRGAAEISTALRGVADDNPISVASILMILYALMQTFCLPGTIAINVVCGTLYGAVVALPMCVLAGTLGACSCYTLSMLVGRPLVSTVDGYLSGGTGVARFQAKIEENKGHLWGFLLFLRVSPVLPNWLINLASPVLDVKITPFATATAVGITPQTFIAVRVGTVIASLGERLREENVGEENDLLSGRIIGIKEWLTLAFAGVVCIVPIILKKRQEARALNTAKEKNE
eukprot:PhM_4_TR9210/c0_g1_i2/m.68975